MVAVNLVPSELVVRAAVKRRGRQWAAAVITVAGLAAVPFVLENRQRTQLGRLGAKVTEVEDRLTAVRQKVATAAQAVLESDAELARAGALKTKRSWAGLLERLSACMPAEVWLTSVATDPPQPRAGGRSIPPADRRAATAPSPGATTSPDAARAPGPSARPAAGTSPGLPRPEAVVVLEAPTGMRLDGFALNHDHLYDLMSKLKESGAFTGVTLVKAGTEPVFEGRAVHFVLACEW